MLAIGAGFALPRTGRTNPDSVCSSSLALSGARIGARARAQAARLCPSPCPARGEDRNSETQGRGRGGRGGGAADAPRGEPGGCRAAACDGSLVCAARGPPRASHGAAPALSPILASRFSRRAQWRPFPSSRKQQYTSAKCADDCNCHIALFTAATVHSSVHPADYRYVTLSRGHPDRCSAVSTLKANLVLWVG